MNENATLHSIGTTSDCGCNEAEIQVPTLDARVIPHAIRHAAVFGVLESLRPGIRVDLLAPHDPLPLLKQIDRRWGAQIEHEYIERGPETFRLRFIRR